MNNEITIDIEKIKLVPDNTITDVETIRQIALLKNSSLFIKIKSDYEYAGLYPEVLNAYNILPEQLSMKPITGNDLLMLFLKQVSDKPLTFKELLKLFLKQESQMGSVLFYMAIMFCLVQYHAYSVMFICLMGVICSIYNIISNRK